MGLAPKASEIRLAKAFLKRGVGGWGMSATKKILTSLEALGEAAECLKVLAHPHRLRMVQMLLTENYTVSELAEACGLPTAMASEHLRLMQRCGFLESEREGRKVYYKVVEPQLQKILQCIEERFGCHENCPKPAT